MGFFNFMETLFFISLGITFILILLLVFHFKQRMTSLEQKSDTMFEIINNIVKELNIIKKTVQQNNNIPSTHIPINMIPISPFYNELNNESIDYSFVNDESNKIENILEEIKDDDEDDEDEDEDEDDEDDTESIEDDGGAEEYSDSDSDSDIRVDYDDVDNSVKENEETEILEVDNNIHFETLVSHSSTSEFDSSELSATPHRLQESETDIINDPEIKVIKLEELKENNDNEHFQENSDILVNKISNDKDDYRKMNLNQLKIIIQSKGITVDVSKLKKNDLLKIIENNKE